jgi:hypothetical protein
LPSLAKVKRFASIVCFDEAMCPDGAAFNDYGVNSGVFKALNLGPTEAVTLEYLIGTFGAERLGNMILNKSAFQNPLRRVGQCLFCGYEP